MWDRYVVLMQWNSLSEASVISLLGWVLPVLIAAALLWWGLGYRRQAIAPTCRRCGYDLSHRPAGVERCSECGANLAGRKAILTTRRRPNLWLAAPATMLLVASVGWLALLAIEFPWHGWFLTNAPLSWVAGQAERNHGPAGDDYRRAWLARDPSIAAMDHLLDLHADPAIAWSGEWGSVLIERFNADLLTPEQRERLLRQTYGPATFSVRSPIRQGDPLVITATTPTRDGQYGTTLPTKATFAARVGGPAVIADKYWSAGRNNPSWTRAIKAADWGGETLPPGHHRVNVVLRREVYRDAGGGAFEAITDPIDVTGEVEVEILPADSPVGTPIYDPTKGSEVAGAVDVGVFHWGDGRVFATVLLLPASVDRSFAVYAVLDGEERRIGSVTAPAGQGGSELSLHVPIDMAEAERLEALTLILVGDSEPLRKTAGQTAFWAGRVTYANVPLGTRADWTTMVNGPRKPTTRPWQVTPTEAP